MGWSAGRGQNTATTSFLICENCNYYAKNLRHYDFSKALPRVKKKRRAWESQVSDKRYLRTDSSDILLAGNCSLRICRLLHFCAMERQLAQVSKKNPNPRKPNRPERISTSNQKPAPTVTATATATTTTAIATATAAATTTTTAAASAAATATAAATTTAATSTTTAAATTATTAATAATTTTAAAATTSTTAATAAATTTRKCEVAHKSPEAGLPAPALLERSLTAAQGVGAGLHQGIQKKADLG